MKYKWTALVLLLVGLFAAYAWQFGDWSAPVRGQVWNISGAFYRVFLLSLVFVAFPSVIMRTATSLMMVFDLVVIGCSSLYLYAPWVVIPGQSCTQVLNAPLGLIGAVLGLSVVLWIERAQ